MIRDARYAISVDGTLRTHRDTLEAAFEAANVLKACKPHSKVVVRDLQTNEEIDPSEDVERAPAQGRGQL